MHLKRGGLTAGEIYRVTTNCEKYPKGHENLYEVSRAHSSEEVSVMEMEQRGEQSISFSRVSIAEKTTSAVINRRKGGRIERDGEERTHGHK